MGDGLGYRRWVYDENGVQLVVLRDEKPHPDAIEVPDPHINAIARSPHAYKRQPGVNGRQRLVRVPRVRLSLSLEEFDADGVDTVEFMVLPEPDPLADAALPPHVRFTVNGQPHTVVPGEVWTLVSDRPGAFLFQLADDRVWASPDRRHARAR
jgi:hypothetical protein